jgi:plasmid stabilization system protein ParE
MARQIRWSDNARKDYKSVVDYLLLEWNEEIALRFIELVEHKIQHIKAHPLLDYLPRAILKSGASPSQNTIAYIIRLLKICWKL